MDADDDEDASFPHHGCGPTTPATGQQMIHGSLMLLVAAQDVGTLGGCMKCLYYELGLTFGAFHWMEHRYFVLSPLQRKMPVPIRKVKQILDLQL